MSSIFKSYGILAQYYDWTDNGILEWYSSNRYYYFRLDPNTNRLTKVSESMEKV